MNSKEKNILFCLHYSGLNNGAVRSLVDVVEQLVEKYDVNAFVIYPDKGGSAIEYLKNRGINVIHIPFYRVDIPENKKERNRKQEIKYYLQRLLAPYSYIRGFIFAKRNHINSIYSNTIVIDYGYVLSQILNVPHIWHIREFGKEDHQITIRGGEYHLYQNMSNSDCLIYISHAIEQKYKSKISKKTDQFVIYNDISPSFINVKKNHNNFLTKSILDATIIGTIQEGKGQLEAIRAVELINKETIRVNLHICGDKSGEYYEKLTKYVDDHEMEAYISFDGFHEDMNAYRSKMDIGIVASKHEAFGRVTIEGMLSQLLMIGSNSDGTSELITNGVNGLLYKSGNFEDLAHKIEWVLNNREESVKITMNGFENARKTFTTGQAAKKINDLISRYN